MTALLSVPLPSGSRPVGSCNQAETTGMRSSGRGRRGELLPSCAATEATICAPRPASPPRRAAARPQHRRRSAASAGESPQQASSLSPTLQHLPKLRWPERSPRKHCPGSTSTKPSSWMTRECTSAKISLHPSTCSDRRPAACASALPFKPASCCAAISVICSSCILSTRPAARAAHMGTNLPRCGHAWEMLPRWWLKRREKRSSGSPSSSSSSSNAPSCTAFSKLSTSSCFSRAGSSW
mmetsp:Transcript_58422/g.167658  ORF Transcript_58422/g.167658 Transcript_58422/m.167658 type:complete len:239 (-) Transcript_58422:716-1432(-)